MGTYFNPDNGSFRKDRNSMIYIDKTGLIDFLNQRINTANNCISISHARRFGKSHAAGMLDAYYSVGSDSLELFQNTAISHSSTFQLHRNKYNVIHLDISSFWDFNKDNIVEVIIQYLYDEFRKQFGEVFDFSKMINTVLMDIYKQTTLPFVIIIDEWDCVVRNAEGNEALINRYLQFLHSIFKSEESKHFLALGYITGILPIKKIKDESSLNNFKEYTMLKSKPITQYFGFTEEEVRTLCNSHHMDFETTKAWYNGYLIDGIHTSRISWI